MLTCYYSLNPHHGLCLVWPWPSTIHIPFLVPILFFQSSRLPEISPTMEPLYTLPHLHLPFGYLMSTHLIDFKHDLPPHVFVWSSNQRNFPNFALAQNHGACQSCSFGVTCVRFSQYWDSLSMQSVHSKRDWFCSVLLSTVLWLELITVRGS